MRQVDQPDAVLEEPDRMFGDGDRDRRLADAAGADNRHEPRLIQIASNGFDRIRPAEDARGPQLASYGYVSVPRRRRTDAAIRPKDWTGATNR